VLRNADGGDVTVQFDPLVILGELHGLISQAFGLR
jgi:hypothetical protein